jgi:hypothetical protein
MTGQLLFVPDLGGSSSAELVIDMPSTQSGFLFAGSWISTTSAAAAVVERARRDLDGGPRDRLAALREAAARRRRTMPMFDDSPDEVAERACLVAAFQELQASTSPWNAQD